MMNLSPRELIGAARYVVWRKHPYYTAALFMMKLVERKGIGTVTTDRGGRVFYDPDFVMQQGVEKTGTLLAHNVQHFIRRHWAQAEAAVAAIRPEFMKRRRGIMDAYHCETPWDLWALAACVAVNEDVVIQGQWPLPDGHPMPTPYSFGLPRGKSAVEYLADMVMQIPEDPEQEGGGGDGDGDDNPEGPEGTRGDSEGEGDGAEGEGAGEGEDHGDPQPGDSDGEGDGQAGDDPGDGGKDGHEQEGRGTQEPADSGSGGGGSRGRDGEAGPRQRTGAGGCGSCNGSHDAGESPDDADLPDPASEADIELMSQRVAQDVLDFDAHGRGTAPGNGLLEWAKDQFKPPTVDWRRLLAAHVRQAAAVARARVDWKMGPPSRRRSVIQQWAGDEAPLLPVLRGPQPRVVLGLDTSRSMLSRSRTEQMLEEALGVLTAVGMPLYGIACDAAVQDERVVRTKADLLALGKGGGGTDMPELLRYAGTVKPKPDIIIILTDGETSWWDEQDIPPHVRVITVVINAKDYAEHIYKSLPPFIQKFTVKVPTR